MWPPGDDVLIVMCGPFPMCKAVKGVLKGMGYTIGQEPGNMVYSYM